MWILEVLASFHGEGYSEFYGPFSTKEKMEAYADLIAGDTDRDCHDILDEMLYHPLLVVPEEEMV